MKKMEKMEIIEKRLKENKNAEVLDRLDVVWAENKNSKDEDLISRIGEIFNLLGRSSDALNCFNAVLKLNSENKKAQNHVEMLQSIFKYYCKDLRNP